MNKRRLLKLADFLDTLPPKRFNFEHWVGDDWKGAQDLSCGTTACAIGWCPSIPAFRRLGLRLVRVGNMGEVAVAFKGQRRRGATYMTYAAASRLFDIDQDDVGYLFVPHAAPSYGCNCLSCRSERRRLRRMRLPGPRATPRKVADHIRRFVERGGIPADE